MLITPDGMAKLVDMGFARFNQVAQADNDLTASGVTLGTFDYISPEQARDPRSADVRSDMYSLGCSFFYMLTGRPPFPDGTVLQKLLQHQADHPPDPRRIRPELPPEVARILTRLLSKNPAHRYQKPAELSNELVALGDKLGIQLNSSRSHWEPARSLGPANAWQRHLPWAVPLGAVLDGPRFGFLLVGRAGCRGTSRELAAGLGARSTSPVVRLRRERREQSTPGAPLPPRVQNSSVAPLENEPPDQRSPAPSGAPANKPADPGAFWQRMIDPFGAGTLEQIKARVTEAANRAASIPEPERERAEIDPSVATGETPPLPAPSDSSAVRENVLVVGDDATESHAYASLHAACNDAKSGDIIELRYNGRRRERPIVVSNIKLTICAGNRYQPVVVFRPEPDLVPLKYPPTMLSIAGGQLYVSDVHWELDLPRDVPSDWACSKLAAPSCFSFSTARSLSKMPRSGKRLIMRVWHFWTSNRRPAPAEWRWTSTRWSSRS